MSRRRPAAAFVLAILLTMNPPPESAVGAWSASADAVSALHVDGNQLVDSSGLTVQVRGVNRSGTEYACIQGWGIFDGPSDAASRACDQNLCSRLELHCLDLFDPPADEQARLIQRSDRDGTSRACHEPVMSSTLGWVLNRLCSRPARRCASQIFWERGIYSAKSLTTDGCCGINSALQFCPCE